MHNKARDYAIITFVSIISTIFLWSPFLFHAKTINGTKVENPTMQTVEEHWDGPLYIIAAKSWYNPQSALLKSSPLGLQPTYFAAHLPLYPATINVFALMMNYPKAMLLATLLASVGLFNFFYYFVSKRELTKSPLILTLIFMFFIPRFLVIRSVGSSEPLFMLLMLASFYFFMDKKYFFAGLFGGLAVAARTPGILLFVGYGIYFLIDFIQQRRFDVRSLWIFLIPAGLLGVFGLYFTTYHDFFAYFHTGGVVGMSYPFSVFNFQAKWVGTAWLEDILWLFFFYGGALTMLWDHEELRPVFTFFLVFFISILCVVHKDISRYSIPLLPFALIAFEKYLTSKKFLIILVLLLPGIYLYSWNFLLVNHAPITDWMPFL